VPGQQDGQQVEPCVERVSGRKQKRGGAKERVAPQPGQAIRDSAESDSASPLHRSMKSRFLPREDDPTGRCL
jgi:hypothetical protein